MRTQYLFACLLVLTACFVFAGSAVQEIQRANALLSAEIETGPERIVLNQDYLIMDRPGGKQHKLPIILAMRIYKLKVLQIREGKPQQWEQSLFSYEICGVTQEELFTWNVCSSGRPLGMFRLFSNKRGENHLAWVESRTVCFSKIAEPRDRVVAITDAVASGGARSPEIVRVPTDKLIPRKYHYPKGRPSNVFYREFSIEALEVGEGGDITLKVASPGAEKVFTLVFDGKEWRKE